MMQRRGPFSDLRQMQDTMDRMWRRLGNSPSATADSPNIEAWAVPLDILRKGEDTLIAPPCPVSRPRTSKYPWKTTC